MAKHDYDARHTDLVLGKKAYLRLHDGYSVPGLLNRKLSIQCAGLLHHQTPSEPSRLRAGLTTYHEDTSRHISSAAGTLPGQDCKLGDERGRESKAVSCCVLHEESAYELSTRARLKK